MANLIDVTFNEGEPLDINKLNNLKANITNTFQVANSNTILNATQDGTKNVSIDFGTINIPSVSANVIAKAQLPIGAQFNGVMPQFIVSMARGLWDKEQISLGVKTEGTTATVQFLTNSSKRTNVDINWIAVLKQ